MEYAFKNHAICSPFMLALCSFFMQYARNMLETYTKICVKCTKLLFHHAVVCARSTDGPRPRQFWAVCFCFLCSNILEYGRKVENDVICSKYARKMMQYARLMLGAIFHRNMLGEYAGMFHEGQLYTML